MEVLERSEIFRRQSEDPILKEVKAWMTKHPDKEQMKGNIEIFNSTINLETQFIWQRVEYWYRDWIIN